MTKQVVRPSLSNSHLKQQAHHRVLAAHVARVLPLALPLSRQGRREGRAPAGTRRSVRYKRCTRGGPQVSPDRPAFPARMVLTVSFVLSSGSDALLPPSPHGWLMCASGRAAHITARLDAQTPGVGTTRLLRPRTSSHASSTAGVCSPSRPCEDAVGAVSFARRQLLTVSRPAMPLAPDAVASIAARPAVRDDRDPPLVSGQGVQCVR